ncbi:MAG TPA: hypothetical protein VMT53_12225 [Terriglobales bacterium]|nr:hypothetical protein [Terriglobales bacterium]
MSTASTFRMLVFYVWATIAVCQTNNGTTVWTIDQVADLASRSFSCDDGSLAQAIALAYAESGFDTQNVSHNAANPTYNCKIANDDYGLWQMNDCRANLFWDYGKGPQQTLNPVAAACGLDPVCNLGYTHRLWEYGGPGKGVPQAFTQSIWHAFGTTSYNNELSIAQQFLASHPKYCMKPPTSGVTTTPVQPVSSLDPNDKIGAQGTGMDRFISGRASTPYSVYFGNVPTATAPAQSVTITDTLSTNLDLSSVTMGPITFPNQVITPPAIPLSVAPFTTEVDLRPTMNLLVKVNASLNTSTGVLTWTFQSLDPATGQPPTDPTVGFLPPGGNGSVMFSVSPSRGLPTNTQIQNQATITFDANLPINTPVWTNTLDNIPPTSNVIALQGSQACSNFKVQWSGSDIGVGTKGYTIYASDNGAAFGPWLTNTTASSSVFEGQVGHSYGFYSIATDLVGNVEAAKTAAEASTTVTSGTSCGPPSLSGAASVVSYVNNTLSLNLQFTDIGTSDALNTMVKTLSFRTLGGSGTVTLANPKLPFTVGTISVNNTMTIPVTLKVPSTVTKFSITEGGTMQDAAHKTYTFSIGQNVVP